MEDANYEISVEISALSDKNKRFLLVPTHGVSFDFFSRLWYPGKVSPPWLVLEAVSIMNHGNEMLNFTFHVKEI